MMLVLVALAIPATAFAAISGQGGGTTVADGKATLVSDGVTPYSFISFDDRNGQPVANLTELSADVVSGTRWGGGSPRFQVKVSDGSTTKNIMVYRGALPNLDTGSTGSTGNLLETGVRIDSTQIGGPVYGTWADAKVAAAAGGYTTIFEHLAHGRRWLEGPADVRFRRGLDQWHDEPLRPRAKRPASPVTATS
jgi:hypothetical protein